MFYTQTFPRLVRETLGLTKVAAALLAFGAVVGLLTVLLHPDGALFDFIDRMIEDGPVANKPLAAS